MRLCVLHKHYGHNVVICTYVCAGCLGNKIRQKSSANFYKLTEHNLFYYNKQTTYINIRICTYIHKPTYKSCPFKEK